MKKKYAHIDLSPELQAFRANFMAATEVEGTLGGIITCYKVSGRYFIRTKSSLTGKRVKRDKKFRCTMHNAGVLALAAQYVTPLYNALTEDWRCHDLYRMLVGIGVKRLHEGHTKEAVQQAVHAELERLGYRTAWPEWELPPNLQQWLEAAQMNGEEAVLVADDEVEHLCIAMKTRSKEPERSWVVNEKGQLTFAVLTSNEYSPFLLQCPGSSTDQQLVVQFINHLSCINIQKTGNG